MEGIIAQRVFDPLYIYLDTAFLVLFCILLIYKKKYMTLIFSLAGGILYMIVDFGIFHLLLGTRSIQNGNLFWVLLWMSMSYGMTNFALLWIWMSKDKHTVEFTTLIFVWWICCPLFAQSFGGFAPPIKIQRTTGAYHGFMAIILFASYLFAIIYNLREKEKGNRLNILWLFAMGVIVQLGWEVGLLIGGIRSAEIVGIGAKLSTLIINSLLETNLGVVPIYFIYIFISSRVNENLSLKSEKISIKQAIWENNNKRYKTAE